MKSHNTEAVHSFAFEGWRRRHPYNQLSVSILSFLAKLHRLNTPGFGHKALACMGLFEGAWRRHLKALFSD